MTGPGAEWLDPARRESCRQLLVRELILRLMIHDVRNPLTPILGALEMMTLRGASVPQYVLEAADILRERLNGYSALSWVPDRVSQPQGPALAILGVPVIGGDLAVPLSPLRLVSALELAAPERVALSQTEGGITVQVGGLTEEAAAAACSPGVADVMQRLHAPDRTLGAMLLRGVAREAGGYLEPIASESGAALVMVLGG